MNTIIKKKILALAGLTWFLYIIVHSLSLLTFFDSKTTFNNFYLWFNNSVIYYPLLLILAVALGFHVFTAISRQLKNNKALGGGYKKTHPQVIPRFIAWGGAGILFSFIVFHFIQMQTLDDANPYQQMVDIFSSPIMWIIYAVGLATFSAHLHHALTNVLQTFGLTHKQNNLVVVPFIVVIVGIFASIIVGAVYA